MQAATKVNPDVAPLVTIPDLEGKNGGVEPLKRWRRLVRLIARQDTQLAGLGTTAPGNNHSPPRKDSGNGISWPPGVAGAACMESVRGEAWEIRVRPPVPGRSVIERPSVGPTFSGNPDGVLALGVRKPHPEVGMARSSDDGRDSITLQERRGHTSSTPVRETRVDAFPLGV